MFNSLKTRIYKNKVLARVENQLVLHLGVGRGEECLGAFAQAITKSDIPSDFLDRLKASGFSVPDAAVAWLDAAITAIKKGMPPDVSADVANLVSDMEIALDKMFLAESGLLVPRNGSAGPSMAEFTTEGPL